MSRYKTKNYSNRREYLDWLAERYGVDRADVVLLSSILGTDQDFDGLPSTLADLSAAKHTQGRFPHFWRTIPNEQNSPQIEGSFQ